MSISTEIHNDRQMRMHISYIFPMHGCIMNEYVTVDSSHKVDFHFNTKPITANPPHKSSPRPS